MLALSGLLAVLAAAPARAQAGSVALPTRLEAVLAPQGIPWAPAETSADLRAPLPEIRQGSALESLSSLPGAPAEARPAELGRLFDRSARPVEIGTRVRLARALTRRLYRSPAWVGTGMAGAALVSTLAAAPARALASTAPTAWASGASDALMLGLLLGGITVAGAAVAYGLKRARLLVARWAFPGRGAPAVRPSIARSAKRVFAAALIGILALKSADLLCPGAPTPTRPEKVSATPFTQRDAVVDGLRLRFIDEGRGPVLLLLPGLTSRIEELDDMTAELRRRYRVIVLDLPGSGYSDKPDRPYSLAFYEDTIVHFLDKLGVERAFVGGGSLGGNLVLRLARRDPARFPKAVAWAPASSWEAKPLLARSGHSLGGYGTFWLSTKVQSGYWYAKDFPRRDAVLEETFAYYHEVMSPGFVRMYWDLVAEQLGTSLQDGARDIHQPVLLLWGDQDDGGGMAAGVARLHQLIPDNRLIVLPGARHSLATERPRELSAAIAEFLGPSSK